MAIAGRISDYRSSYFRISKRLALVIIFPPPDYPLALRCNFAWKRMHFYIQQRTAIEKQFIAFSCNIYTVRALFFRRLCVKKWMNENFGLKICEFYWMGKINFLPPTPWRYWCSAIFYPWLSTSRDVDLIRWKKYWNFHSFFMFFGKVIFHSCENFYAASESEHLTNCDRIQWQLTQFVNQFPLHALNIPSCHRVGKAESHETTDGGKMSLTFAPRWNKSHNNCCFCWAHQYFINFAGFIDRRCHKFKWRFFFVSEHDNKLMFGTGTILRVMQTFMLASIEFRATTWEILWKFN